MTELTVKFTPPATKDLFTQEQLDAMVIEGLSAKDDNRLLKLALLAGGSPNAQTSEYRVSAIYLAASLNDVAQIRLLASFGGKIDAESKYGNTALFEATQVEAHLAMRELLRLKANVNHQNSQLYTVLMYAIDGADFEGARLIMTAKPDLSLRNEKGQTALEMAREAVAAPYRFTEAAKEKVREIIKLIEAAQKPVAQPAAKFGK